jgi:phosphoenolpyruvate phosphomutase
MPISIKSVLEQHGGRAYLCETHDHSSTEVIGTTFGDNGQAFDGLWYSGLCQTTYLGIPDTELISPLQRASLLALNGDLQHPKSRRPLCAAYDADGGGDIADIPALVSVLAIVGVSMIIIEDKAVSAPGAKINSLAGTSGNQAQADPHEFAKSIKAFKAASARYPDMMTTARIESFTTRKVLTDEVAERASQQASLEDALHRAKIYTEAGVDSIMIHSKAKDPTEVLEFLRQYRAYNDKIPLVVVPTAYATTTKAALHEAGANVVIYANHLMRAKILAISQMSDKIMAENPSLFANDPELNACVQAKNYGCLLRKLWERRYWGDEAKDAQIYRIAAATYATENMRATVKDLLEGEKSGCEADKRIISVKELLKINGQLVVAPTELTAF